MKTSSNQGILANFYKKKSNYFPPALLTVYGLSFSMILSTAHASVNKKQNMNQAEVLMKVNGSVSAICSKSIQNCSIQVSQNGCTTQNGSVTLTNYSNVPALNITASSDNTNFTNYVVQNNACPASLPPGESCTISFYTNTAATFVITNVVVQGTNTNATTFNMNATPCNTVIVTPIGNTLYTPLGPQTVPIGSTVAFNLPDTSACLGVLVLGTCPFGSYTLNGYTTGIITSSCSVIFDCLPE